MGGLCSQTHFLLLFRGLLIFKYVLLCWSGLLNLRPEGCRVPGPGSVFPPTVTHCQTSPEPFSASLTAARRNQEHKASGLHALSTCSNPRCLIIHSNAVIRLLNDAVHSYIPSPLQIRKCKTCTSW